MAQAGMLEPFCCKNRSLKSYTNSINDCNTSLGQDAMNRVSTNGLSVAFFFAIGIRRSPLRDR
ncbi:MAG: hypothetical protein RM338_00800 [Nostoc sp. DedQUE12a]|nr:hypothetical protein [Nostoc sp. DedQUE12a]